MSHNEPLNLFGAMTPRAAMSIIPKVKRPVEQEKLIEKYLIKSIKRNIADGNYKR